MNLSSANSMLAYICIHIKDASVTALTTIDQPLPPGSWLRAYLCSGVTKVSSLAVAVFGASARRARFAPTCSQTSQQSISVDRNDL